MDFGEIIEPSSRAFWDEFDELEENLCPPTELEWQWTTDDSALSDLPDFDLFVIEGSEIFDFVNTVLLNGKELIAKLKNAKFSVYACKEKMQIFFMSEENNLNLSSSITELLVPWLKKAKSLKTISVLPKTSYKGDDITKYEENSFIKEISPKLDSSRELDPPNFITGVSSGVACWRYLYDLSVHCYVVYVDSEKFDQKSTKPIIDLLKGMGLDCKDKYTPKAKDESHLYM